MSYLNSLVNSCCYVIHNPIISIMLMLMTTAYLSCPLVFQIVEYNALPALTLFISEALIHLHTHTCMCINGRMWTELLILFMQRPELFKQKQIQAINQELPELTPTSTALLLSKHLFLRSNKLTNSISNI